jgi:hypothetical protein
MLSGSLQAALETEGPSYSPLPLGTPRTVFLR